MPWSGRDFLSEALAKSVASLGGRSSAGAEQPSLARLSGVEPALWDQLAARSREGVLVADLARRTAPLVYVNAAFEQITGYSAREAIGRSPDYLWGNDRRQPGVATLAEAFRNRKEAKVTLWSTHEDGRTFLSELRVAPIFDDHNTASHYLGIMRDLTGGKSSETAMRDPVTGLLDRSSFRRQLETLMSTSDEGAFLLVKADIIDFHELNISFGYDTGDGLLREIADRLRRLPDALVGRIAADNFAIALHLPNPEKAKAIAEEIHQSLESSYTVTSAMLNVRFAVGYTIGPKQHGALRLLRDGSVALHEAKRSGRRLVEFDQQTRVRLEARGRLTTQLQQAITRQEFRFSFQPKIELASGRLVGAQGILRWRHPDLGDRAAYELFSLAEETGLILPIGRWALREVIAFIARCNQGRGTPLTTAIRVAALDLGRLDLLRRLPELTHEFGVEPAWLSLELGEDVFGRAPAEVVASFGRIRDMGFGLSIKNFGAHFASSEHLGRLRASEIKIDSGFVKGMLRSRVQRAAVESVIRMGEALGADVTAEGVDTAAEAAALRDLNCRTGQGAFLGEPMADAAFLALANGADIGQ